LLLVIVLIAILAALLLPVLAQSRVRGKQTQCASHLKQVGVAFHLFAHDHGDRFPMQVSTNVGGTLEFAQPADLFRAGVHTAFRHFQALSNGLGSPRLLICPGDTRLPAPHFAGLRNEHVSYFAGLQAEFSQPDSVLAGDRNIAIGSPSAGTVVRVGPNQSIAWTREFHAGRGTVLFADSRVEQLGNAQLNSALHASRVVPTLALPAPGPTPRSGSLAGGPARSTPTSQDTLAILDEVLQIHSPTAKSPGTPSPPQTDNALPSSPTRSVTATSAPVVLTNRVLAKTVEPTNDSPPAPLVPLPATLAQSTAKPASRSSLFLWLLLLALLALAVAVIVWRQRRKRAMPVERNPTVVSKRHRAGADQN
jgi:type II secretory pathway pseudopilin PulG